MEFIVYVDAQEQNKSHAMHLRRLEVACRQKDRSFSAKHLGSQRSNLPAGDYILAARKTGATDQQSSVLMVIERKTCQDLWRSIQEPALKFGGKGDSALKRIDIQMRNLYYAGENVVKLLLLEGSENTCKWYHKESKHVTKDSKIKAIKTFRKRFKEGVYYPGMSFVQTQNLKHTIEFICDQLVSIKRLFNNGYQMEAIVHQTPSLEEIKSNVDAALKDPRFILYTKLVQEAGVSAKTAMARIKSEYPGDHFICPRHRYYGRKGDRFQCQNVESKDHMPTFYQYQDFFSDLFELVHAERTLDASPIPQNVDQRSNQIRQNQSSAETIDLVSDDEGEANPPKRRKNFHCRSSSNVAHCNNKSL